MAIGAHAFVSCNAQYLKFQFKYMFKPFRLQLLLNTGVNRNKMKGPGPGLDQNLDHIEEYVTKIQNRVYVCGCVFAFPGTPEHGERRTGEKFGG